MFPWLSWGMINLKINPKAKVIRLPEVVGKGYKTFWNFKGRYRVCKGSRASKFLSTPSARRATGLRLGHSVHFLISIHALCEEGDASASGLAFVSLIFLSTPSARRATAKTETKSLFSNKLYNILHEFRRALIYNGSKNYPNHAKRLENPVRRCRKDAENSPFALGRETQNNSRPSCSKDG